MKEEIYTIPVIDAFNEETPCPFCSMYKKLDSDAVIFMLGPSYMEDDIRTKTNETGFCRRHYERMYAEGNRLGLSLMCHTHLHRINGEIRKLVSGKDPLAICEYVDKVMGGCFICDKIDNTFERYVDTFFYMWKNKRDFIELVKKCRGFCIGHYAMLIREGKKKLSNKEFQEFLGLAEPIEQASLQKLEDDLDWFIMKYDYRNREEPWKDSKDAPVRALTALSSIL